MMMKQLFYLMLCVVLLAGCGKDKNIEGPDEPDEPEMPAGVTLELSDADMVFEAEGGEKTFTITCSRDWTIVNESDWCTTDVTSGSGNRTVTVTARTYGELADRNTNVTVKAGDKTKVLTVTQKYGEAIIPDKSKFEVPQEGGDLSIKVRSSVTYEVSIPDFCSSWIRPAPETRSGISDTTYRFIIGENESDTSRMGSIVFSSGSVQDTVRIYQAQKDCLVLTQKAYSLLAHDTTIAVELRTNVDYDVTILGEASSWISRVETRASRVDRLQFHIDENTGGVLRTAKIVVQDKNGTLTDTIYIRQSDTDDPTGQDITADFDPEFAKVLQEKGYIPDATHITIANVKDIDSLNVGGTYEDWEAGKGLTSLKGIEYFESLTVLYCYYNQLSSLNVSNNTALTVLYCYYNQLTSLDVSRNTALTELHCENNRLTSLDVGKNMELEVLTCSNNQLTSLDVSNHTALFILSCDRNHLTSLDVNNTALTVLCCYSNQLTSLDISNNTALTQLNCDENQLTSLDVSSNTALRRLTCSSNQLTSLDVSRNTALTDLWCDDNQLTSLDVSRNTALEYLYCYNNPGDGESLFPVMAWFDNHNIPGSMTFGGSEVGTDGKSWGYDGKTIRIDFRNSIVSDSSFTETVSGISFEMVYVKGGTFRMGTTEEQRDYDEKPAHEVTLTKDYYIGKFEVTQELWEAVMGTTIQQQRSKLNWAWPLPGVGSDYPMYYVIWKEAQSFCAKLSRLTGRKYALPTEAQWEYAARGGVKSKGYKYSGSDDIDEVAWYDANSGKKTHPVGEKRPNELGLYDMSGNVWEWCSDWYGSYSSDTQTDPTGPARNSGRVLRGGGWGSDAGDCWVSSRGWDVPDYRHYIIGFRVVCLP